MCQKFSRRHFMSGAVALTALSGLSACGTNRATGRSSFTGFYSIQDDIELGQKEHPELVKAFGGEYDHKQLNSYMTSLGNRLAQEAEYQEFTYTFTLLNSPVVNAFALPGGYVYVSRGLLSLASSEAELAGVLAHEIGHVNARHTAERLGAAQVAQVGVIAGAIGAGILGLPSGSVADLGQSIAGVAIQSYSRSQELEADTLGVRYMAAVGYDPEAMVTFLSTLREQSIVEAKSLGRSEDSVDEYNIMATHPRTIDRVNQARREAAAQVPPNPRVAREEYLRQIDGMLFGDDPKQGIVQGSRFVHPELRFEFEVPSDFLLSNRPDKVIAQNKAGAAIIFDMGPIQSSSSMADYVADEWGAKLPLENVESIKINGIEAGTGQARLRGNSGTIDVRLVAIRDSESRAFRLAFVSPADQTPDLSEAFRRTTYSFRRISEAEAQKIRPLRLEVRTASAGDRVSALSQPLPYGEQNDAMFRVLNDLQPGEDIQPGSLIKVVTT